MSEKIYYALLGGFCIGMAANILFIMNGRIAGISQIFYNFFFMREKPDLWRPTFIFAMLFTALIMAQDNPLLLSNKTETTLLTNVFAGLLVGLGAQMGGGCTSGHGVCGISRFSTRSIIFTILFMIAGASVVYFVK